MVMNRRFTKPVDPNLQSRIDYHRVLDVTFDVANNQFIDGASYSRYRASLLALFQDEVVKRYLNNN